MCLAALVLLMGDASARELTVGVRDVSVIDNGAGLYRVLFKLEPSSDLQHVIIGEASLNFAMAGTPEPRRLRLHAYPVTTSWSAGSVSWTTPWTRPGGDFDQDLYASTEIDLSRGATTVGLDLTLLIEEIVEAGRAADGFLITVDPSQGRGLSAEDVQRLQGLRTGGVEIECRTVPHPIQRS
jgi:hypothetical protein